MKTEDWSNASTSQGTPKIAGKSPEARKGQGRICLQVSGANGPADMLISAFSL